MQHAGCSDTDEENPKGLRGKTHFHVSGTGTGTQAACSHKTHPGMGGTARKV